MPNSSQHQARAAHNRAFLGTINLANHRDWAAVVAFYAAVHLAERLRTLAPHAKDQHSINHQDRLQYIHRHHSAIHTELHELYNASVIARYQTINSFNTQFTVADVQNVLIGTYLTTIENYVANQFAPLGGAAAAGS